MLLTWCKTYFKILNTEIKFNKFTSEIFSLLNLAMGICLLAVNAGKAANSLMQSHRTTRSIKRQIAIESILRLFKLCRIEIMKSLIVIKEDDRELLAKRIFVLKEPNETEKGVLIVSFDTFGYLGLKHDMKGILNNYFLILEPSWSGYCAPEIMQFLEYKNDKIIIQAAERIDYNFLNRLKSNLIPIDIGAGNWVDERVFYDLHLAKEYDCIMIAQWGEFKRHHILFSAIKKLKDPTYKACLIGAAWGGRTRADIEKLLTYYGIQKNVEIYEKLTPQEVNLLLNKSKVSILLSLKEGSNRAIFEGMFANIPVILLKENVGVNKSYINKETGVLIKRSELGYYLKWFRKHYTDFQPRLWALDNITCRESTKKMEELLKNITRENNLSWSKNLEIKVNRPEFVYYNENVNINQIDLDDYKIDNRNQIQALKQAGT